MLSTLRADTGQLLGCCEWHLVNQDGQQDINGSWVWLQQLELAPGMQMAEFARWLIQDVAKRCPTAHWAYWQRRRAGSSLATPSSAAFWYANKLHQYRKDQLIAYSLKACSQNEHSSLKEVFV